MFTFKIVPCRVNLTLFILEESGHNGSSKQCEYFKYCLHVPPTPTPSRTLLPNSDPYNIYLHRPSQGKPPWSMIINTAQCFLNHKVVPSMPGHSRKQKLYTDLPQSIITLITSRALLIINYIKKNGIPKEIFDINKTLKYPKLQLELKQDWPFLSIENTRYKLTIPASMPTYSYS